VPVLIGVVALAVLAAAIWFGKGLFTGGTPSGSPSVIPGAAGTSTASPSSTSTTSEPTPTTTTTEVDPLAAAIASCRTAWGLQTAARNAAWRSLGEWDRHLDIMNNLQARKISLATAKAQWPATTANAPANIAAFHTADKAFTTSEARCAADASATGPDADALRQCAASMKTVDQALARARTAIAPWETHLKDQSHFKAGSITPATAEAKWRALWQRGLATVPAYQSVAPKAQTAPCKLPA